MIVKIALKTKDRRQMPEEHWRALGKNLSLNDLQTENWKDFIEDHGGTYLLNPGDPVNAHVSQQLPTGYENVVYSEDIFYNPYTNHKIQNWL